MLSCGVSSRGEAPRATRLSRRPEKFALKMATAAAGCCVVPPHPYRQN